MTTPKIYTEHMSTLYSLRWSTDLISAPFTKETSSILQSTMHNQSFKEYLLLFFYVNLKKGVIVPLGFGNDLDHLVTTVVLLSTWSCLV